MHTTTLRVTVAKAEVYRQGCTLTLRGITDLEEGENLLVVDGLPLGVDETSVTLSTKLGVAQGQVRVSEDMGQIDGEWAQKDRQLTEQINDIDRRIANKETELDAWKGMSARVVGPLVLDYLDRLPDKLSQLSEDLMRLRAERSELNDKRDRRSWWSVAKHLEANLVCSQAGPTPIVVTCRSSLAGWDPLYDVIVEEVGEPLSLRLRAEVWQDTDVDWDDVELSLSTGTSRISGDLPRFFPRYLSKRQMDLPAPVGVGGVPRMRRDGELMAAATLRPIPAASAGDTGFVATNSSALWDTSMFGELVGPEAEASSRATAVTYTISTTQTLASGSERLKLMVGSEELSASYYYYAYPRKESAAYLVARLDKEPAPEALAKPLSIYLQGSYAGSIRVGLSDETGYYELPLGRDERVRVRRTEDVLRTKKLLGTKEMVEHRCRIEVDNRKDVPISIAVLEQVPVSQDKDIEVTLTSMSNAHYDERRGELRWERKLEPGKTATFTASYLISHTRGLAVEERERRQPTPKPSLPPVRKDLWGSPGDTIF